MTTAMDIITSQLIMIARHLLSIEAHKLILIDIMNDLATFDVFTRISSMELQCQARSKSQFRRDEWELNFTANVTMI